MYFSKLPEGYPGAGGDIILTLSNCDPDKITEARIMKAGAVLGIKRFRGEKSYDINVSSYLRDTVNVEPLPAGKSGFFDCNGRMQRFSVSATQYDPEEDGPPETASWIGSGEISYTGGLGITPAKTDLTGFKDRHEIRSGEILEIPFISGQRTLRATVKLITPELEVSAFYSHIGEGDNGMYVFVLDPSVAEEQIEAGVDALMDMTVTIRTLYDTDDTAFEFTKNISVRDKCEGAVRLCWQNVHGSLDYFTFSPVRREGWNISKNRLRAGQGYRVTHIEAERTIKVQTAYYAPEYLSELAGILRSAKVRMVSGAGTIPVDVVNDRITIDSKGLGKMTVTLRTAER